MVGIKNHTGLREWLAQRVTAILIGVYVLILLGYFLRYQPMYFAQWHSLFTNLWMKMATFVTALCILWHAWIGLWTVFTDYVNNTALRMVLQILVIILLFAYVAWCFEIMWAVRLATPV